MQVGRDRRPGPPRRPARPPPGRYRSRRAPATAVSAAAARSRGRAEPEQADAARADPAVQGRARPRRPRPPPRSRPGAGRTPRSRSPAARRRRELTPVSSSSGSSAVVQMPVKNSRRRDRPLAARRAAPRRIASRARATAGYSAAASAWASDPPIVPRLRIWKWPISGVARDSRGSAPGDQRRAADLRLGGGRPDPRRASAALLDAAQRRDPADVDEVVEHREPQGEHRDQALPAGDQLRASRRARRAGRRLP